MKVKTAAYRDRILANQRQIIRTKEANLKRAKTRHERNPGDFTLANIRNAERVLVRVKEQYVYLMKNIEVTG